MPVLSERVVPFRHNTRSNRGETAAFLRVVVRSRMPDDRADVQAGKDPRVFQNRPNADEGLPEAYDASKHIVGIADYGNGAPSSSTKPRV